jgi:flagellar basal body-associated protein FliL
MLIWILLVVFAIALIIIALVGLPWLFLSGSNLTGPQKKQLMEDMKKYQKLQDAMDNGEEIIIREMTLEEKKHYLKELEVWKF